MSAQQGTSSNSESDGDSNILNRNGKRTLVTERDVNKRNKTKSLYRQPTVNELNRLQETESLFNSNLFRLQVLEVLEAEQIKDRTIETIQNWFYHFKAFLLDIPNDDNEYDLTENILSQHLKVKIPVSGKLNKTRTNFIFYKYSDVEMVGSVAAKTAMNTNLTVDIQITIPADTFTKNDSINYRYHNKRAAYLAYIASHLKKCNQIEDLKYRSIGGHEMQPVLEFKPIGPMGSILKIRINLVCQELAYKLHRFHCSRNNLREAWMFPQDSQENNTEVDLPTPYYNHSILWDLTSKVNFNCLSGTFEYRDNLIQAAILLKIWILQRNLQVSGHIMGMYMAYLVQTRRISNGMSSYQIVRNIWTALKSSEWDTKGISLQREQDPQALEVFHKHFPVVFLDCTGCYNLCWQMCRGTYCALKKESELAVMMLDNTKINSFDPLFMKSVLPLMQFDHILRFRNLPSIIDCILKCTPKELRVNYGLDELALVTDVLYTLLRGGLGQRADLILPCVVADFTWTVNTTIEKAKREGYRPMLMFGFVLNPESYANTIDKGPSANLPQAAEFRAFWGEKAELRRFDDGTITEACLWSGDTSAERRTVTKQIINYLLSFKYDICHEDLFHICDQLDTLIARRAYGGVEGEEAALLVLQAFQGLQLDVRALTDLPLNVSAVNGASPVFSYCEPFPSAPIAVPPDAPRRGDAGLIDPDHLPEYTPVSRAIVELGHSGKWPGDLEAFQAMKAAYYVHLAERLGEQFALATQAAPQHLDVLKDGHVFRLLIAHPKEVTLLRQMQNSVEPYTETEPSIRLQLDTVLMPRLRGSLHGLQQRHPTFGPTACLMKRWLSAHQLAPPHVPDVVADLLTAAVFLLPDPMVASLSPTAGLMRVLDHMTSFNWENEILLLDFNDVMTSEEITALEQRFRERKATAPPMYIVTEHDGELPSAWTHEAPSLFVLRRMRALAKSTMNYMRTALLENFNDNVLGTFVPSLAGYDVLLYLHRSLVPYATERLNTHGVQNAAPLVHQDADVLPVADFNPVAKYLEELRAAYGDFALFFHDAYGGDVIGVLWKSDILQHRELQISVANGLIPEPVGGSLMYRVNREALVEDFRQLGEGLLRNVVVKP